MVDDPAPDGRDPTTDEDRTGVPPDSEADAPTRAAVRATYDRIGAHFAKTRVNPWPEVEDFLDGRTGGVGLDIGCGNGRHTALLAECCDRAVGLDASRALLDVAREQAHAQSSLVQGDAGRLPLASGSVDLAVYVATLHHLPTRAGRIASLTDLARVLAPGARALVSAWSTDHDRFDADEGFDTTVDWTLPGGETVDRFYHIYDAEEFRADLRESGVAVRSVRVSSGNCYAVVGPEGKRP
ncbi:SAM-dependent methyltransferase [Halobacteriales archaeon QH_6_68_27]|nr:MAG: SAM-dependent methyltransferase [Halobacteriales archaeon QH_6_68_27]